jgi:transcriptional regulator with XRE-family HTH domain
MLHYSEFGLQARATMLQKGITLAALAQQVGIHSSYLSEILKGTRGTKKGKIHKTKIAEILGIKE